MYCSKCGTWAPDSESLCGVCGAALQVQNAPPPHPFAAPSASEPVAAPRYGGFWRRLCAAAVDLAIFYPFTRALEISLGIPSSLEWTAGYWGVQTFLLVVSWLYSSLLESSHWQGTLGQQLLDLRVTTLEGRRVSFARSTGRHFGQVLSVLTLGIGYLMIAFTARKQGLHDKLAGCVLVRGEPEHAAAPRSPVTPASLAPAGPVA